MAPTAPASASAASLVFQNCPMCNLAPLVSGYAYSCLTRGTAADAARLRG